MKHERNHFRIGVTIDVEVEFPSGEKMLMQTKNLSEGGVFLEADGILMPPIGTVIYVKVSQQHADGEEPARVKAQIVHSTELGVGIQFIET
jgi:hypothetical protein